MFQTQRQYPASGVAWAAEPKAATAQTPGNVSYLRERAAAIRNAKLATQVDMWRTEALQWRGHTFALDHGSEAPMRGVVAPVATGAASSSPVGQGTSRDRRPGGGKQRRASQSEWRKRQLQEGV